MADLELSSLPERPGWDFDGTVARFTSDNGWYSTVRRALQPGRSYERVHVCLCDPSGRAVATTWCSTTLEAVRIAEARTRAGSV